MVADPSQFVDQQTFLDQLSATTSSTFMNSFEARIVGTIVGNILAGGAFKLVADVVSSALQRKDSSVAKDDPLDHAFGWTKSKSKDSSVVKRDAATTSPPQISREAWLKLLLCILIDAISDSSFILPGIGELEDVAWAPLSAFAMKYLFDSDAVAIAEFVKEILPFTDIIPLASTVWLLENVFFTSPIAQLLKLDKKDTKSASSIQRNKVAKKKQQEDD